MSEGRYKALDVRGHFVKASAPGAKFWHIRNHKKDGGSRTFCGARVALDIKVRERVHEDLACKVCAPRAENLAWIEWTHE